ncbi:acyl-CoA dehydrogenase [Marinobacter salexigens]|uniref:Acyl-CoA dehydrogenase n=1 Tax=Marinobacter salexigens TaxID=1925763 RepID=A0ABS6A959_9GAMM|nr:acyl-CoA dehydrogenase [Marinobacter salexigens]MBU2874676.1 acyl-CoA dehydrogenase [Marinobacter salexigens]
MIEQLLDERDITFQLYEVLDSEKLLKRPRYSEHNLEAFKATLDTAQKIAKKYFANHNHKGDAEEPEFDGEKVKLIPETLEAWNAFAESGFLAAHHEFELGGMQLPEVILRASMAYFNAANIATTGYPFLSIGAANLIKSFASESLRARFLPPMLEGRFSGTMALTEPNQGSALADIKTKATPQADGTYLIRGQKMYISGGDHELTENIVHMVLAKIEGAPAGVKGISLFIVPKFQVDDDGQKGVRNDVALAGLLHKMGYRNTTSTVLNFGEKKGALGYLVGEPHKGLQYMFQMMNEARIGVALGAAALGYQGYITSLAYARQRPQGRLPSNKNPESKQVNIIDHADVRRMLLAQKSYAEGAFSLCLFASSLFEDQHTAETEEQRNRAAGLLDLLTPVVKSWPSKYCLQANDLAIQVLGGAGYTREYPVEQYYRDNRLNPIHEGTEAIHGLDLLGRKIWLNQMAAYKDFKSEVRASIADAYNGIDTVEMAKCLDRGLQLLDEVTDSLGKQIGGQVDRGLANATVYLDLFGRVVGAWIWLRQAIKATEGLRKPGLTDKDAAFYRGKLQAARYYLTWELPMINPQADLLKQGNSVCFETEDQWF